MSRVLAIRPKVRGFKPGRGDGYLRPINIRSTHSFGGEVKPEVPCCKILQHVKKSLASMNKHTSQSQMHHSLRPFLLLATRWLCWQDCQRALVDESGIFLCRDHSTMAIHAHVSPGGWTIGPLVAAVQRRSLTPSTWSSSTYVKNVFSVWTEIFSFLSILQE
jgi:hypothetical protein